MAPSFDSTKGCAIRVAEGSTLTDFPKKLSSSAVDKTGMAVRRTNHAELVWIGAKLLFQGETVLQRLASVFPLQHVGFLEFREVEVALSQVS